MIFYNMRYRGPYEYDKFTLNVLQIYNAVTLSEMHELNDNGVNKDALLEIQKDVNDVYDSLMGTKNTIGITEKIYLDSFTKKGD